MPVASRRTLRLSLFAALLAEAALAQDIQPFQAQEVKPIRAQDIQPIHADEVKPIQADDVKPIQADEVQPAPAVEVVRLRPSEEVRPADDKPQAAARPTPAPAVDLSAYFGTWRTKVSGAVWESPSATPGYNVLHVSAGARAGDLVIKKNGTYTWQSYGGKKGRWEKSQGEYPLVLVDTVEHKRWLVRFDPRNPGARELLIWDGGSFTYEGRR